MELNTSAITGAMRIGVQIIVARKRPVLEIYQQSRNQFGPEEQYELPAGPSGNKTQIHRTRFQDIFIDLTLVNIGGERAESVTFEIKGSFRRHPPRDNLPEIFSRTIKQLSPGQSLYLMRIDKFDLLQYEYKEESGHEVGKPVGMKQDTLKVTIHYDGPASLVNRVLRFWRRWRGFKQYSTEFLFDPEIFEGDLPPAEYA
nr:hypothetical protein [uncultured Cohaesibacter sp.]